VPFGDFFSHFSPFMGSKPQFWGVNRRFQAKLAKSKKVHIIITTASIPTKFRAVIKTTKCPSWVVPTHALHIQDGGRPPSWKNRKTVISRPRFERFWRNLAWRRSSTYLTVPTVKNSKFKNKSHLAKTEKLPYLGCSLTNFDGIWRAEAVRPSWPFLPSKIWNFKNARWRRPP